MSNKLIFNKIESGKIFYDDFKEFNKNNEIEFNKGIAILYGPNGTGKTSLSRVLASNNQEKDMCFDVDFEGKEECKIDDIFHVISDQNGRNIIKGEAKDYLLGDDIAREENLAKEIDKGFSDLYNSVKSKLKDRFSINTKGNKLIETVPDIDIRNFIIDFSNSRFQIATLDKEKFIKKVNELNNYISNFNDDNEEYKFIIENFKDTKSIIYKIKTLKISDIKKNEQVKEIEENNVAIKIIGKFSYKEECVVCENKDYDKDKLLEKKKDNKEKIEKSLDAKTKKILKEIINLIKEKPTDPLNIERILLEAIDTGDTVEVERIQSDIDIYLDEIGKELQNLIKESLDEILIAKYEEYKKLIKAQFKISKEDELYLTSVISENIGREIDVKRDKNNKIKITLGDSEILGTERDNLGLSTGEQNFISLAFELLKAKNTEKRYIVLDDPISSFDSIYKNKIAFCIIKFLEDKKQIILTHNTELIKLLEFQKAGSFELYIFNNTEGAENGFIGVNEEEQELLLKLDKLLALFRKSEEDEEAKIWQYVKDKHAFLVSMIPFMRGYANIIGESEIYKNLCKVMHGYESDYIDIASIYSKLFKDNIDKLSISTKEILELECVEILDNTVYPLLNKSLYHTLNYLILRLKVEQKLCSLDNDKILNKIKKAKEKPKYKGMTLQNIIFSAFRNNIEEKVFFTSRKTLLNEFNHFEGNLNIFQPAIDITDKDLEKEKEDILKELRKLENNNQLDEIAITYEQ
ncbi:MAG: AAA family ATPase [Paraclostridium sp.]